MDPPVICPLCKKSFYASTFAMHVQEEHSVSNKPFKCHICQDNFATDQDLSHHKANVHKPKTSPNASAPMKNPILVDDEMQMDHMDFEEVIPTLDVKPEGFDFEDVIPTLKVNSVDKVPAAAASLPQTNWSTQSPMQRKPSLPAMKHVPTQSPIQSKYFGAKFQKSVLNFHQLTFFICS